MQQTVEAAFRLPHDVLPKRYELRLTPDIANSRFAGEETVSVEVTAPVRTITLNAIELDIHTAELTANGRKHAATVSLDEATERAVLTFTDEIPVGPAQLRLTFTGVLNDKLRGFYRSAYRNEQGEEHFLATTQFESTDARRAFPCWDEPAFKAVFAVTLVVDQGLTALSSGSVKRDSVDSATGKRVVEFNDTVALSTYLLAFVVGEFEGSPVADVSGVPVRIWAPPGKGELTPFALAFAKHALQFFIDYYSIPYPGDKLDLLAIPDFSAGAMENLGAITFREVLLLLDEQTATHGEFERVAAVEGHEIAHMWFGDLVTMQWWNGLWLKEAFASFMELLAVDDFKPEWDVWTGFGIDRAGALIVDALHSTRPIEYTVVKPEDAAAMYDVLTYQKGAAVLRMLEQYLGGEQFRAGINEYLRRHAFANAETSDLWDALEDATKEPVRHMMDSWIFQPGYPLISAEVRRGELLLSQQRFQYRQGGDGVDQLWDVPIAVRVTTAAGQGHAETQRVLLTGKETSLPLPPDFNAAIVNAGGNGVFRVRYSPELLRRISGDVLSSLSAIERFNLVNDAWASVQAGYTPLTDFLDFTALFREETDRNVWAILLSGLGAIRRITPPELRPQLEALVRDRLAGAYAAVGWESRPDESDLDREFRGQMLGAMGVSGNDLDAQETARTYYNRFTLDATSIDPEVAAACIGIMAFAGGEAEYADCWQRFKSARNPQDERRFLFSLTGFKHEDLIRRTLDHALDGEIRTQDAPFIVGGMFSNSDATETAWRFMTAHWDEMLERYPDNTIMRMADGVVAMTRPELADEVEAFFKDHHVPDAGKRLDQALERMRIGVDFRAREEGNLARYLS
ncbi:MAG: M1 family metallopeptidase [Dehalococcoidia bacterium]